MVAALHQAFQAWLPGRNETVWRLGVISKDSAIKRERGPAYYPARIILIATRRLSPVDGSRLAEVVLATFQLFPRPAVDTA